ncbi:MAG: hypothetical protein LBE82_02120 [Chitinophagaceae bacterium]|jgi:hypothetical protein|nr:hypothetical protein [Chitinophagaceae bacterium]
MSRISVTVKYPNQAFMLVEWLKNIRFVQHVAIDVDEPEQGKAETVQKILDTVRSENLFADIIDPVAYQKQIRNEWK